MQSLTDVLMNPISPSTGAVLFTILAAVFVLIILLTQDRQPPRNP